MYSEYTNMGGRTFYYNSVQVESWWHQSDRDKHSLSDKVDTTSSSWKFLLFFKTAMSLQDNWTAGISSLNSYENPSWKDPIWIIFRAGQSMTGGGAGGVLPPVHIGNNY